MNGWSGGAQDNSDYLISPAFDLSGTSNEELSFTTALNFSGPALEVKYSTNYDGVSDPTSATWNSISATFATTSTFTSSGIIDVSGISASSVHFAFVYASNTVDGAAQWDVDDFSLMEGTGTPTIYSTETSLSGFAYEVGSGPSASQMFDVSGSGLEADVTVTAPTNYEVSLDDAAFSSSVTTPMSGAATTVYVRLKDGLSIGTYNETITLSSTNATNVTVALDGEVTEEVVLADFVVINEIDADTEGNDALEFIELYDGGVGNTALDGLVVVLFNGSDDQSYDAIDLDGYSTDANGYFVIGSATVPNVDYAYFTTNGLQNGADAVALIVGDAADYPNDTPIPASNIQDAIVYDTNDADDAGLLVLLNASEPQLNEDEASDKDNQSLGRWTDGSGGQRNTSTYENCWPTPGGPNNYGIVTGTDKPVAQVNVYSVTKSIVIESGIAPVSVYSLDGKLVFQGTTQNTRTEISVENAGVYFVRINQSTTKVIVR